MTDGGDAGKEGREPDRLALVIFTALIADT